MNEVHMPITEVLWRLGAGVLLIALNAFFVAVEFALTRIAEAPEGNLEDSSGLRTARRLTEELELHLTGCQLGISSTSVVLGVVAEPAITEMLRPAVSWAGIEGPALQTTSVVLAVVVLNLVHKIWGEQAPTYLGVERPREVAAKLAPILAVWSKVAYPVIKFGDGLAKLTLRIFGVRMTRSWTHPEGEDGTDEDAAEPIRSRAELKSRMAQVLTQGHLPPDRRREVERALEIGVVPVREVMIERDDMTCLALDLPLETNLRRIGSSSHVRFPVVHEEGGDDFAGVLYVQDLLADPDRLRSGEIELGELLRPEERIPADEEVSDLIDRLQEARQEIALVEEDGRVVGMVTITDALEAIVGELEDPLD